MKFKKTFIRSKSFDVIHYFNEHSEMFADYDKKILSGEATELQKEILKCYQNDRYFATLPEKKRNEIFEELTKYLKK